MKTNAFCGIIVGMMVSYACGLRGLAQDEMRVWKNPQGRELKAVMVELNGAEVTLRLESGTVTKVPLRAFSLIDQAYVKQAAAKPAATAPAAGQPAPASLTWPLNVLVDPKDLDIKVGRQDPGRREFEYNSGSFCFISKAPLSASVMKTVAADFELARQLMVQLPWTWKPESKDGGSFKVYLTETQKDFVELGGSDNTDAGSKDDYVFIKLSALGLKKLGARYSFDLREKSEAAGEVMDMIMRLLIGDMRLVMLPWAAMGMETFTRQVAYHKGTLKLSRLETSLKAAVANEHRTKPDAKRMVAFLKCPWEQLRGDVAQIRAENYFDGMMLVYFFGYLDGDGKGARFHGYGRAVAQEALAWRAYEKSRGALPPPRPENGGSAADWSMDLLNIVLAGRSDQQLQAEITAKFKSLGIKFD